MIDSSWRNFHAVNFERIKQDIHNDKSPTTIPLDGLNELVLSGYGFASSAFSSCFILFRNTTQYFSPVSIEDSRVVCDFSNLDLPPGYYDIGFSQGGLVGMRRGRIPAAVSAALTGGLAYTFVYEPFPLQDIPDMLKGSSSKDD